MLGFSLSCMLHPRPAGDFKSAVGDFTRAISLSPALAKAYSSRATAYLNQSEEPIIQGMPLPL